MRELTFVKRLVQNNIENSLCEINSQQVHGGWGAVGGLQKHRSVTPAGLLVIDTERGTGREKSER